MQNQKCIIDSTVVHAKKKKEKSIYRKKESSKSEKLSRLKFLSVIYLANLSLIRPWQIY